MKKKKTIENSKKIMSVVNCEKYGFGDQIKDSTVCSLHTDEGSRTASNFNRSRKHKRFWIDACKLKKDLVIFTAQKNVFLPHSIPLCFATTASTHAHPQNNSCRFYRNSVPN